MSLILHQKHTGQQSKPLSIIKKVPVIPPTFVNNKLVANFTDKATIFNDFFSKQC